MVLPPGGDTHYIRMLHRSLERIATYTLRGLLLDYNLFITTFSFIISAVDVADDDVDSIDLSQLSAMQ